MSAFINVRARTRLLVKGTPWLYRPAKRLTGRGAPDHLCDRATDLCIEGYPSSGNSFSFAVLRLANPNVRIAHHCHSIANFRLALAYAIPAVCLIRMPEDAIASRLARFQGGVHRAVMEYVSFYDFVLRHIDVLTVVTFEEVTQETGLFLNRVARASGLPFEAADVGQLREAATAYMTRWTDENAEPDNISLPRAERDEAKARIRDEVRASPLFGDAQMLWQRILQKQRK